MELQLSDIESVEQLENFQDEYVYDIEVDNLHNFFANDILVHNSCYIEFGRIPRQYNIFDQKKATRMVVDIWNYGCGPYMDKQYDEYAKRFNCDKNLEALELEKVADTAIMVAKKHYAMSECFLEPNIYVNPKEHVIYKGLEVVQGSTPPFARKCLDDFYRYILNWYETHADAPTFIDLLDKVKTYKADFIKQRPDDICKAQSVGDYNKFIIDDKNTFTVGQHCPIHVKAAGIYNYLLNQDKNKKYRVKYNKIKTRDKVKFYKTTDPNFPVFGFLPKKYPVEIALPIDYNQLFEDTILGPINTVLNIFNYSDLTSALTYTSALF